MSKPKRLKITCLGCIVTACWAFVILISYLIVMSRYRLSELLTPCVSNEKQLSLGLIQYQQDNDDSFPSGAARDGYGVGWAGELFPYIKRQSVFQCPKDDSVAANAQQLRISYGFNSNVANRKSKQITTLGKTILLFETQGSTATVADPEKAGEAGHELSPAGNGLDMHLFCGLGNQMDGVQYATGFFAGRIGGTQFAGANGRHYGGANYAFADGHVRWLKSSQVSAGATALHPRDAQTAGATRLAAGSENGAFWATFSAR